MKCYNFLEIYHIVSQRQIRDGANQSGNQPSDNVQTIQVAPTTEHDNRKNAKCCSQ